VLTNCASRHWVLDRFSMLTKASSASLSVTWVPVSAARDRAARTRALGSPSSLPTGCRRSGRSCSRTGPGQPGGDVPEAVSDGARGMAPPPSKNSATGVRSRCR
jgi:hypothetical protein